MGPYLATVAAPFSRRVAIGRYYGVDVDLFRPATGEERAALRERLELPRDAFLIVLSSRVSHEKDPETVLQAVAFARARGLNAVLLNLGGGYREFQALAAGMGVPDAAEWVLGRPAAHPMKELADYYRAADVLVQGSLEEGLGFSPLEALACEVPTVASAVGGLAAHLGPVASLTPRARRRGHGVGHPAGGVEPWRGARAGAPRARLRGARTGTVRGPSRSCSRCWPRPPDTSRCRRRSGARMMATLPRVALISDLREERWHSMDLVSELLLAGLRDPALRAVDATELCPRQVHARHSSTMGP
jgi:hypothetical protein